MSKPLVVQFGGGIQVRAFSNTLIFKKLATTLNIGDTIPDDIESTAVCQLDFTDTRSIDIVIEQLEKVKRNVMVYSAC
jgi:hypothetical protein